ncbi:DUF6998 domain-containing protein [Rhodoglobus aureus]|uniref:DUF6998 domain-containing protein n=1 Tax=Rhodoglobus aureus TaxID=191497 RepID=A0ABP4G7P1_9MICO
MVETHSNDLQSLLTQYVSARNDIKALTSLARSAGIARTDNLVGELGEYLALQVYGGELAVTSARDIDLIAADYRRIQVKTRALPAGELRVYDFASLDFDLAVCVRFEIPSFELQWAREFNPKQLLDVATPRSGGVRVTGARARDNGADVTHTFRASWESIRCRSMDTLG